MPYWTCLDRDPSSSARSDAVQVHWEFWSNANDMCGPVCDVQKRFMKVWRP